MRAAGKIEYAGPGAETSCHPVETATLCHARSVAHGFAELEASGRRFQASGVRTRRPGLLVGGPWPGGVGGGARRRAGLLFGGRGQGGLGWGSGVGALPT